MTAWEHEGCAFTHLKLNPCRQIQLPVVLLDHTKLNAPSGTALHSHQAMYVLLDAVPPCLPLQAAAMRGDS